MKVKDLIAALQQVDPDAETGIVHVQPDGTGEVLLARFWEIGNPQPHLHDWDQPMVLAERWTMPPMPPMHRHYLQIG